MRIISHRGNLFGSDRDRENHPEQIDFVLKNTNFDVEIDIWCRDGNILTGHDYPKYQYHIRDIFDPDFYRIYYHCKDVATFEYMVTNYPKLKYFFQDKDQACQIGSTKYLWLNKGIFCRNGITVDDPTAYSIKEQLARIASARGIGICTDIPVDTDKLNIQRLLAEQ